MRWVYMIVAALSLGQPATASEYNSLACYTINDAHAFIHFSVSASEEELEARAKLLVTQDRCVILQIHLTPEQMPPVVAQVQAWFGSLTIIKLNKVDSQDELFFIVPDWNDETWHGFIEDTLSVDA